MIVNRGLRLLCTWYVWYCQIYHSLSAGRGIFKSSFKCLVHATVCAPSIENSLFDSLCSFADNPVSDGAIRHFAPVPHLQKQAQ